MEIKRNFDLKAYNTFGVSAKAELCSEISSLEDLQNVIEQNKELKKELYPLGGGSNILLTKDLNKWVLINKLNGVEILSEDENDILIEVMSGENWHEFVMLCLEKAWFGLENLSLIPGLVGASPIQNIGAYGIEVKDFITHVKAIDLKTGEMKEFNNSSMNFDYRNSVFKQDLKGKYFISHVGFKLHRSAKVNVRYKALLEELASRSISDPSPKDVSDAVIAVRQSKLPDPKEIGNSGSFFKNPVIKEEDFLKIKEKVGEMPSYHAGKGMVKLAAGWLIDQAGWKGYQEGDFGVHKKQALVLVNYGDAKGIEIKELSDRIIEDIKKKFGVTLEREVNIL